MSLYTKTAINNNSNELSTPHGFLSNISQLNPLCAMYLRP